MTPASVLDTSLHTCCVFCSIVSGDSLPPHFFFPVDVRPSADRASRRVKSVGLYIRVAFVDDSVRLFGDLRSLAPF